MSTSKAQAIVYSCSGCSNVAQLANQVALELNRQGQAEMSCIAGVGGQVKSLVKQARSGRPILALDGCALHCVKQCLEQVQVIPTLHLTLTHLELKKVKHQDFSSQELELAYDYVTDKLSTITA